MYDQDIINAVKDILLTNKQSVAVAESVTAGHLQVALASAENASKFFQGGITAYNIGQKARHLQIEPIHAESCNCVSENVAAQMALHVNKLFSSNWGIAVTGYAAPVPECDIHELFAYYAIAFGESVIYAGKITSEKTDPMKVQVRYTNSILIDFHRILTKGKDQSSFSIRDRSSINSRLASAGPFKTSPSME